LSIDGVAVAHDLIYPADFGNDGMFSEGHLPCRVMVFNGIAGTTRCECAILGLQCSTENNSFPNEVAWVRSQGGVVWWIERDGIAPVRAHASENSIGPQDCDRTIPNLGTLDDLAITVEQAWAQLEAERMAA
jgi:hypothetical protein